MLNGKTKENREIQIDLKSEDDFMKKKNIIVILTCLIDNVFFSYPY